MFADRTNWNLTPNRLVKTLDSMKKAGTAFLDLTESNPTRAKFEFPENQLIAALSDPKNSVYDPSPRGLETAREAVASYYEGKGVSLALDQIFLTASTSEAYSLLLRLLANPGDSILVPRPGYPLFDLLAGLNDVAPAPYFLTYGTAWGIDTARLREAAVPSHPKALIIVNPNNPTGSFVKRAELREINRLARDQKFALIADEVFSDYAFHDDPERVPTLAGNQDALTFTLSGVSKVLGLPQMKLAWLVVSGPPGLTKEASARLEMITDTYLSAATPPQNALGRWLDLRGLIQKEISKRLRDNLELLRQTLSQARDWQLLHVEGGWYATLRLPNTLGEEDWALELLRRDRVYVHPGYFFDFEEEGYIVLSLLNYWGQTPFKIRDRNAENKGVSNSC